MATLADLIAKPRNVVGPSLADMARARPVDEEAGEKPVVCEPRLDRSTFGYLEPRQGIDGLRYFGQCSSCRSFVPETAMRGAVVGSRCALFGTDFSISDDDLCDHYTPWDDGKPHGGALEHMAKCIIEGHRAALSPWQNGYRSKTCGQCMACRNFDAAESECELFEQLTKDEPDIFTLDEKVKPNARCSAWTPIPPPEPLGLP